MNLEKSSYTSGIFYSYLQRLRTGTRRAGQRDFYNQAFQKFTDTAAADGAVALALSQFRRYISPAFPENTASKTR
jgi:hypothetical protein